MPPRSTTTRWVALLLLLVPILGGAFIFPSTTRIRTPPAAAPAAAAACPSPLVVGRRLWALPASTTSSSSSSSGEGAETYVLSGPTSDDERAFELPATLAEPIPLPEAVERYGGFSSPSKARKLIRRGQVLVNGQVRTCADKAGAGDKLEVRAPEPRVKRKDGKARGVKKVKVLFEDDHLAVIIKPAGVAVHGTGAYSLVDRYAEFLAPTARPAEEALPKPVHAHRLDAPVGGLLVVAKTFPALRALTTAFEERRVHKQYRAVVMGCPPAEEGSITDPVDGKEALTRYKLVNCTASASFGELSQLDLFPETGRKHQLRVHCAQGLGTPILGDLRYGPDDTLRTRGLFLFSYGVAFAHPVTGEPVELAAELPEIYGNTVNMERKRAEGLAAEAAGDVQDGDDGQDGG